MQSIELVKANNEKTWLRNIFVNLKTVKEWAIFFFKR